MISYDISDSRRRREVQKLLEGRGDRVQFSVFECTLNDAQLGSLKGELTGMIEKTADNIRFYRICEACKKTVQVLGVGTARGEEDDFFIV